MFSFQFEFETTKKVKFYKKLTVAAKVCILRHTVWLSNNLKVKNETKILVNMGSRLYLSSERGHQPDDLRSQMTSYIYKRSNGV